MTHRLILPVLLGALAALPAGSQEPPHSLAKLPVTAMKSVAPQDYASASELAADGGSPVGIALEAAGPFDGPTQHIIQECESGEAPSSCKVTVIRDGLPDDAVRGERWEIALGRAESGDWKIRAVKKSWRCWRSPHPDQFSTSPCP